MTALSHYYVLLCNIWAWFQTYAMLWMLYSQKIYVNNCVRPDPDPQDYIDFPRFTTRWSLWDLLLETWCSYLTTFQELGRTAQPYHQEFYTPCKTLHPVHLDIGVYKSKTRSHVSYHQTSDCRLTCTPQSPLWRGHPGTVQTCTNI
jgi:hypothetical protein